MLKPVIGFVFKLGDNLPREAWYKLSIFSRFGEIVGFPYPDYFLLKNTPVVLDRLRSSLARTKSVRKTYQKRLDFTQEVLDLMPLPKPTQLPILTFAKALYQLGEYTVTLGNKVPIMGNFFKAHFSEYTGMLRPTNEWRKLLWGQSSVKRGRQSNYERVVSYTLRGSGSPRPRPPVRSCSPV